MPERANDAGFAMTGSFTCMLLSALWIFDQTAMEKKERYLEQLVKIGQDLLSRDQEIQKLLPDFLNGSLIWVQEVWQVRQEKHN